MYLFHLCIIHKYIIEQVKWNNFQWFSLKHTMVSVKVWDVVYYLLFCYLSRLWHLKWRKFGIFILRYEWNSIEILVISVRTL